MRILLVEDDPTMADAMRDALGLAGMVVDVAGTIAMAQAALAGKVHDVLLLDRRLPDGDGISLIPGARRLCPGLPVIVLSARGELGDRVKGLDVGADDYLVKPVAVEELLARIRAIFRRPSNVELPTTTIGSLVFDFGARDASVAGVSLQLPRRQLLLLEALAYRHGRTVRREVLMESVYGFEDAIESNALDTHISRLRRSLAVAGAEAEIHAIRGVGYLIKAAS